MVRRLGLGKNNHLTYASLALNPRFAIAAILNFIYTSNFISILSPSIYKLNMIHFVQKVLSCRFPHNASILRSFHVMIKKTTKYCVCSTGVLLFIMCRHAQKAAKTKRDKNKKAQTWSKIFRKNPEAVKCMNFRQANESVLSLYLSLAYTNSRYSESTVPAIGAREIDGLPQDSMAELLVNKYNTNSCDGVG